MTDTTLTRPPTTATDGRAAAEAELETAMALMEVEERTHEETNPLRAGLALERVPSPCVMVIFGVTGDLTGRKLMPALYDLAVGHPLPEGFTIVGVSHRDWDDDTFRTEMRQAITDLAKKAVDDQGWDYFAKGLYYVKGDFKDPATY